MVYDTEITIVNGVYKPTSISGGAPHFKVAFNLSYPDMGLSILSRCSNWTNSFFHSGETARWWSSWNDKRTHTHIYIYIYIYNIVLYIHIYIYINPMYPDMFTLCFFFGRGMFIFDNQSNCIRSISLFIVYTWHDYTWNLHIGCYPFNDNISCSGLFWSSPSWPRTIDCPKIKVVQVTLQVTWSAYLAVWKDGDEHGWTKRTNED